MPTERVKGWGVKSSGFFAELGMEVEVLVALGRARGGAELAALLVLELCRLRRPHVRHSSGQMMGFARIEHVSGGKLIIVGIFL